MRKGGGLFLGLAVILFIFSAFMLVSYLNGSMPKPAGAGADLQNGVRGVLLFLFTLGLLVLCGWLAYKMLPGRALKVIGSHLLSCWWRTAYAPQLCRASSTAIHPPKCSFTRSRRPTQ